MSEAMENTTLYTTVLGVSSTLLQTTFSLDNTSANPNNESGVEESEGDSCCNQVIPQTTYMAILNTILALGLLGNVLILWSTRDNLINSFSYSVYLRALAVSDSLVLITICTEDNLDNVGKLGEFLTANIAWCKIWTGLSFTVAILSPWLVVLLTFDRYIGVVFPKKRASICTLRVAAFSVTTLIAVVLATRLPDIILAKFTMDDEGNERCDFDAENKAYVTYTYISTLGLSAALPCFLILGFNLHFVYVIQRYAGYTGGVSPDGGTFSGRVDRTTCSLMMVSAMAFVTLVPKALLEVIELAWTIQHDADVAAAEEAEQEPPAYPDYLLLANNTWPVLNLIYLLNFGQNFYVMLITNFRYREVLQRTLFCRSKPRTAVNEDKTENDPVTTVSFSTTTQL
ncbi:hypothetical protein BaRGS_00016186 [Batillaria attramentaria]|uniref:G-protein coupled receptors family 1 profile domain-containing protein n=1 Tax=Batillaria attramentaria TaxID=370345 RepID=A0ABD0L075_9CAEN